MLLGAVVVGMLGAQQASCADLVGGVADTQARPIPDVKIVVNDMTGKVVGEAQTDSWGQYRIAGLRPGTYNYVLDPVTSGFKGGDAVAYLGPNGMTTNWNVSTTAPSVASGSEGGELTVPHDPPGSLPLRLRTDPVGVDRQKILEQIAKDRQRISQEIAAAREKLLVEIQKIRQAVSASL